MADDKPFWFARLAPRNQFGATVISIASLAERVALRLLGETDEDRSFDGWETPRGVLAGISRGTPAAKIGWFDPRTPVALKSPATLSIGRFFEAVAGVVKIYTRPDGPLERCTALDGDAATLDRVFVDRAYAALTDHARGTEGLSRLLEGLGAQFLKRQRQHLVAGVVEALLPGEQPSHPLIPSRSLLDPLMVQAEFLPVRSDPAGDAFANSCDLYAVIREARGWTPTDPAETNMIVRDLLWIRDTDERESAQDLTSGNDGTKLVGIYFSTVDQCSFYVERVVKQGSNVIITARTMHDPNDIQYLSLIFASRRGRQSLVIRDGIVSGCAGTTDTLAAWKCLIIRPEWPFFHHLRTILHEATLGEARSHHDPYTLCLELQALGVIHSRDLVQQADTVKGRRNAFRQLLLRGTKHPGPAGDNFSTNVQSQIEAALQGRFDDPDQTQDLLTTVLDAPERTMELVAPMLRGVVEDNWHLIEPAQIVSYPRINSLSRQDQDRSIEQIRSLLSLKHTQEYRRE